MGGMLIGGAMFGQYSLGGTVPDDIPPFGHYQDLLASATESQAFFATASTGQSLTATATTSQALLGSLNLIDGGD